MARFDFVGEAFLTLVRGGIGFGGDNGIVGLRIDLTDRCNSD